ncbi:purple acid phosphatase 20-like [Thraustotheca clavata]|uniref:Purple acid phosphatase n=1 Tax=Thraustotheca clavata TaxID=74557 RepID=A0A1W0A9M2_9STRA|nr:purple acid phosphatase 20-like [Thraustotheca clavata]
MMMNMMMLFVYGIQGNGIEQVHMAIAGEEYGGMAFSWIDSGQGYGTVKYGVEETKLDKIVSTACGCIKIRATNAIFLYVIHGANVVNCFVDVVGNDQDGWSNVNSFTTPPQRGDMSTPLSIAIVGDLGQTNYSIETLKFLQEHDHLDAVFVAGDLSYADTVQERWDMWGQLVEPCTSTKPWMVGPGNHEIELSCALKPFEPYQARFRMPFTESGAPRRNLFYSFDLGGTHTIFITPYIPTYRGSAQYVWLERDLMSIDRTLTPWLIVVMHGPWYNSNKAHQNHHEPHHVMKKDMEELLYKYHVNIVFSGHVHAYERSVPVYKNVPTADGPVYVVVGDGGNREGLADTFIEPKPEWSAFRKAKYGYGHLTITNTTHAYFAWHVGGPTRDKVADSIWLVKR